MAGVFFEEYFFCSSRTSWIWVLIMLEGYSE